MKKIIRCGILWFTVIMLLSTSAYAEYELILTESWPVCFFTGDVPNHISETNSAFDNWRNSYSRIYGGFYAVYTNWEDRADFFSEEMTAEEIMAYVRENYQHLIADELLPISGVAPLVYMPRRMYGEIKDVEYQTICYEYLIPLQDGMTAVLNTPDGYVFLGGEYDPMNLPEDGGPWGFMHIPASEQSGWRAIFYEGDVCSVQRFCGNEEDGYFHINERYAWGDLTDKQETVENLLILPIEDCRGMMATASQNWALEQAIVQSQSEGFAKDWQLWKEMWEMTEETDN